MDWDDYQYILAVAQSRTLKLAAQRLNVDQATVGRRISALQKRLATQLLEKRSDGYYATAIGARVLEMVTNVEREMLSVERTVLGKDERVEGIVKVAMPGALANQWLIGTLDSLLLQYPGLEINFLTGPELLNLSRREADIAIRLVRPEQRELKTRKVGTIRLGLFGQRHFEKVKDLSRAPFVGLYPSATSALEKAFLSSLKFEPRYRIRSSAWSSVYSALRAGLGIGILPTFIGEKDKNLKLIREDRAETPLWLVVHPEVASSARVRATIDHFTKVLA